MKIIFKGEPNEIAILFTKILGISPKKCEGTQENHTEKCDILDGIVSYNLFENILAKETVKPQNEIIQLRKGIQK